MIQGTTSDAGKSVMVTGLCRLLLRRGFSVAPFKPQNMALNSSVTIDGGEIGRAQAVQAQACKLEASIDMNPVLLKPNTDIAAQVIIHGKVAQTMDAVSYHERKPVLMKAVIESYTRLQNLYDYIVVEGAGSPAEINLRDRDIANMGFAEEADCPVILVADIDKGGVFAHLYGTLELLSTSEQNRVIGFIINKFRGDINLLSSGLSWLEEKTSKPVLGVLPYLQGFHLEAEDAIPTEQTELLRDVNLKIIVPVLSRISNHTDFDPLRLHPQVDFEFIGPGATIPPADLIILPGTKNVRSDLEWLNKNNWVEAIHKHLRYGGKLLGICGGYQMLGTTISDPEGLEGKAGSSKGLGLMEHETTLLPQKQLKRVKGKFAIDGAMLNGYEIHSGVTKGEALERPAIHYQDREDGAISEDRQIIGCYLHGLFEEREALTSLLNWAGLSNIESLDYKELREAEIDRLADAMEEAINFDKLFS